MKKILLVIVLLFSLKAYSQDALRNKYTVISDSLAINMRGRVGLNNYVWPDSATDYQNRYIVPEFYRLFFTCFPDSVTSVTLTPDRIHNPAPIMTSTIGR